MKNVPNASKPYIIFARKNDYYITFILKYLILHRRKISGKCQRTLEIQGFEDLKKSNQMRVNLTRYASKPYTSYE